MGQQQTVPSPPLSPHMAIHHRGTVRFDGIQIRPTRYAETKAGKRRLRTSRKKERFMEESLDKDWRHIMGTEIGVLFQNAIGGWNPVEIM